MTRARAAHVATLWAVVVVTGVVTPADARPLRDVIPGLFGREVCATLQSGVCEPRLVRGLEQFTTLSTLLRNAFPAPPVPSASGAFRFAWDSRFDTFRRETQSLGPIFAERAETLGRGKWTLNVAYSRIDFDTLEGDDLGALVFTEPALPPTVLDRLPPGDRMRAADDLLRVALDLDLTSDVWFFTAAYGVTDTIDASLGLSVSRVELKGSATMRIVDDDGEGDTIFADVSSGAFCVADGRKDTRCVTERFDESAFGTGDVFLRVKWLFATTRWADLAAKGVVTIPTGNADDFLGFKDPTFTPTLIASKTFGRLSPHANLGYAVRTHNDVGELQWIAGADVRATDWLTLSADFLGFHDDKRDDLNDDVLQSALGIKVNPFGRTVIAGSVQLPLNRDGLRADVIYTVQVEQTL